MLLDENPFHVLAASTRDSRARLMELAEEQILTRDPSACARARAVLLNPRQRLRCEIAWLPGLSPNAAAAAVDAALRGAPGLFFPNPVARVNAMLTGLAKGDVSDASALAAKVVELGTSCGLFDPLQAQAVINEDREVAGLPLVSSLADVEAAIGVRLDEVATTVIAVLRTCPRETWLGALTEALKTGTADGVEMGSTLLHRVVDRMAADLQQPLDAAGAVVGAAVSALRPLMARGNEAAIEPAIAHLESSLREWDRYAQPLQLSAKARGQAHHPSREMHLALREVALELHNEHELTAGAHRITTVLLEVFAEDLRLSEALGADNAALDDLLAKKQTAREMEAMLAELTPIKHAPSLHTINGIGTVLYGRRNEHQASDTYVATLYFTILFVPLLPLRCYRVRQVGQGQWRFFGSVPFSAVNKLHAWCAVAAVLLLVVLGASSNRGRASHYSSASSHAAGSRGASGYTAGGYAATTSDYPTGVAESRHEQLGRWIELERTRLNRIGATLQASAARLAQLEADIDDMKRLLNGIASQASPDGELPSDLYDLYEAHRSRYNSAVDEYNAALAQFRADDAQYEVDVSAANDSVMRYNGEG